jgi:hypothetical protein
MAANGDSSDARIRQALHAWRLQKLREAIPALALSAGLLVLVTGGLWLAVTHPYHSLRPDLYCTHHYGGEICTASGKPKR